MSWKGHISRQLQSIKILACPHGASSEAARLVFRSRRVVDDFSNSSVLLIIVGFTGVQTTPKSSI
jgi:hypothetical protein